MSKPQSDLLRRTIVASLHGTTRHDIVNKDLGHHVPLRLGRGEGEIYNTLKAQRHELARGTAVQPVALAHKCLLRPRRPLGHAPACVHEPCMSLFFSWVLPAVTVPCTAHTCEALSHVHAYDDYRRLCHTSPALRSCGGRLMVAWW